MEKGATRGVIETYAWVLHPDGALVLYVAINQNTWGRNDAAVLLHAGLVARLREYVEANGPSHHREKSQSESQSESEVEVNDNSQVPPEPSSSLAEKYSSRFEDCVNRFGALEKRYQQEPSDWIETEGVLVLRSSDSEEIVFRLEGTRSGFPSLKSSPNPECNPSHIDQFDRNRHLVGTLNDGPDESDEKLLYLQHDSPTRRDFVFAGGLRMEMKGKEGLLKGSPKNFTRRPRGLERSYLAFLGVEANDSLERRGPEKGYERGKLEEFVWIASKEKMILITALPKEKGKEDLSPSAKVFLARLPSALLLLQVLLAS